MWCLSLQNKSIFCTSFNKRAIYSSCSEDKLLVWQEFESKEVEQPEATNLGIEQTEWLVFRSLLYLVTLFALVSFTWLCPYLNFNHAYNSFSWSRGRNHGLFSYSIHRHKLHALFGGFWFSEKRVLVKSIELTDMFPKSSLWTSS